MLNMADDSGKVDIGINNVPEELRNRFRAAAAEDGMTYETMLDKLLKFRENNKRDFKEFDPEKRPRQGKQYRGPE